VSALARRGLSGLCIGWLLFLLEPLSSTGLTFPFWLLTFAITVIVGVIAFGLAVARRPASPLGLLAWTAYPVAAAALVALFLTSQAPGNPLFRLRFYLSVSALEETARLALLSQTPPTPRWVGLFPVRRIDVFAPEVWLISDGCGVIDECGLLYRSDPLPGGRSKTRAKPIAGPWYHLYAAF
jgi:hypothetical protein